jgi:hypothetical protein
MHSKPLLVFAVYVSITCNENNAHSTDSDYNKERLPTKIENDINPYRYINEIPLPNGFIRIKNEVGSFTEWLLNVKLKIDKTVYTFDGKRKANQTAQFAVLDISVGRQNLQQCADAVMRIRAEYLFASKKYTAIHFTDNEKNGYQFSEPYTAVHLHQFLQKVFGMCGSASLSKQLHSISFKDVEPGDVLIRGGFPGHAVIVMDVAQNKKGEKIYMLAQSYMPAQDIHLLINPANKDLSPWYFVNDDELIQTPEYIFKKWELKRW